MIEVVFRFDPERAREDRAPASALEARQLLEEGNRRFVALGRPADAESRREVISMSPDALGLSGVDGEAPAQAPFAVVLGCADARVPVELVFQRAVNDLFVVRVAGNVLGSVCLGSIEYAVAQLAGSVRIAVVLGHTSCGAVTAAVDAFLQPAGYQGVASSQGLRSIVDSLFVAVRGAALALEAIWGSEIVEKDGYREALVESAVVANAALTALTLQREIGEQCEVLYGVYDLVTRRVRVPVAGEDWEGLRSPPDDVESLRELGRRVAGSDFIRDLLYRR